MYNKDKKDERAIIRNIETVNKPTNQATRFKAP